MSPPREAAPPAFLSPQVTAARRFYDPPAQAKPVRLTVVCAGWEHCRADYCMEREDFPYWSVEFVAAGEGDLKLGGKSHALAPGTVFVYGPGWPHRIASSAERRLSKYFVDFVGRPSLPLLRECGLAPGSVLSPVMAGDIRTAFDTLIALGEERDEHAARLCSLQLELLLRMIRRGGRVTRGSHTRAGATVKRVRECMDTRFLELKSVTDLARACHLDASHLSRLLRRFGSEPPLRYLQRRKMQWAAERLLSTGLLVRQVADALDMDPFHFSRTFKRVHGVSPTTFLRVRM